MESETGTVPPVPATTRPHRWGLVAFVVVEATYLVVSLAVSWAVLRLTHGRPPAPVLAVAVAVPTATAALLAVVITRLRGNGPRIDLNLRWSWRALGLGFLFGFGGLAITLPASLIYLRVMGEGATSAAGQVFGGVRTTWIWAVAVLVLVVVVAPIFEEVIYRGLLWNAIEWRWGRWVAFAVSTVVFAAAHLELSRFPLLLVVAVPVALARLYSGSLVASIAAHSATNLLPGLALMFSLLGLIPTG